MTLVEIVTFLFVFKIVLASIFSICLLSLHNRNNCRYGETMFAIITLHNDNNRNGESLISLFKGYCHKVILSKLSDQHYNNHVQLLVKYCIFL